MRYAVVAFGLLIAIGAGGEARAQGTPVNALPLDCSIPDDGPLDVRGRYTLPEALTAVERRELTSTAMAHALTWAWLDPDPANVPVLKRIVEVHRCGWNQALLAMFALEATGEPSEYFAAYARDWRTDDLMAINAFQVLATRGDTATIDAVYGEVGPFPPRGVRGGDIRWMHRQARQAAGYYPRLFRAFSLAEQAAWAARTSYAVSTSGNFIWVQRRKMYMPLLAEANGTLTSVPRRALRRLGRTHPSLVEAALLAAEDSTRARFVRLGFIPADIDLVIETGQPWVRMAAFPTLDAPPPVVTPTSPVPALDACIVDSPGIAGYAAPGLLAEFSYRLPPGVAYRVPYGSENQLSGVSEAGAAPPEVFGAPGAETAFRVRLASGETASWTLLGQSVAVSASSPRCGEEPPAVPTCNGRPATVYVGADGRVVGGPLDGRPFAGTLDGTDGPDTILGTDADDVLLGRAGDDTLCGDAGHDAIDAGPGTDTADGGDGTDGCNAAESATACDGAIPALPDVRPVLECVAPLAGDPDGRLRAYFGYENRSPRAGRVAYGANNRVTPTAYDRRQPDLFALPGVVAGRPGRTPFYPGHAFTVDFRPGERVVWKLGPRTSTASAQSARCAN